LDFKGIQTFWENPKNSPKLYLARACTNIILDDITCIVDFNVPLQVAILILGENLKDFNLNLDLILDWVNDTKLTPGVSQPNPLGEISPRDYGKREGSKNRSKNQSPTYLQAEVQNLDGENG
jgi:hypothetical protein